MKKLKFLVSLLMAENPYQRQHAVAAQEAGRRFGVEIDILYAKNDPLTQVEQLLNAIQSSSPDSRPAGIVCAPVGTTLMQVARQAATAGPGAQPLHGFRGGHRHGHDVVRRLGQRHVQKRRNL